MDRNKVIALAFAVAIGTVGRKHISQYYLDRDSINRARQDEMQANGLEDECKATINQNGSQNIAGVAGSVTSTTQSGLVDNGDLYRTTSRVDGSWSTSRCQSAPTVSSAP